MKNNIDLSNSTILIVDDQPSNVMLLSKLLAAEGYTKIIETTDPLEAEPVYLRERPDIVLLDLNMPYLDGFQVMARLRELDPEGAPIVVLTAQMDSETRLRALQEGAVDFVSKPFDRYEVMARIRNQLEVRMLHRKLSEQNENLERTVAERTHELVATRLDIIRRLGRACEFRDNETGAHIERMSRYSYLLGLAAGLNDEQADMLLNASPMHDVGKIGIPDAILLKPGKLTDEEYEIIKSHPIIGGHILSGSGTALLQLAEIIALTHHEKWDGSGYPRGLKGEDIPLEGRIVAITDVFDALTTSRIYKKTWSIEDAIMFIEQKSGTHFDPTLVPLFVSILPKILQVRNQFPDTVTQFAATV